jgi:hypothetical protein
MRKIPGVQSARVSLAEGRTFVDLGAGNNVTLARLRSALRDGGFVSGDALVEADGTVAWQGDDLVFTVSGTNEALVVTRGANASAFTALEQAARVAPVAVRPLKGTAPAPERSRTTIRLDVATTTTPK